ncbi:MAG TPA: methylated-DNA--[protein]-cysteine S-methyltransferase [Rhodanobacteraceae bacterium]|nr:methylated-DNA--[protein]-cysteine S-methyltransferase [Rhodanobacteraceae bacterium]
MHHDYLDTPIGPLLLVGDEQCLVEIGLPRDGRAAPPPANSARDGVPLAETRRQFDEYFAGTRTDFDLPLAARGTAFQRRVWDALRTIVYGETVSYAEIARRIGKPAAVRAVGAANGANPLAIVVPCHRVIGADGSLTGYGGGLPIKRFLLDHERRYAPRGTFALQA